MSAVSNGHGAIGSGLDGFEGRVAVLVLARAAAAPAAIKVAEIARDLNALCALRTGSLELRAAIDRAALKLLVGGELRNEAFRCRIAEPGRVRLARTLGVTAEALPADWAAMRDRALLPFVLGLALDSPVVGKGLASAESLQAAILVSAFALPVKGRLTPVRLRAALAVAALERSFGDDIGTAFGSGKDLPARAARMLASRLLAVPRAFASDGRLIAAVAAEQVHAGKSDVASLRAAIMSSFLWGPPSIATSEAQPKAAPVQSPATLPTGTVAPTPNPLRTAAAGAGLRPLPPDISRFATAVLDAAGPTADGWPGNRKALICDAWKAFAARRSDWRLSEADFKALLVEAHRTGRLALATADLKDPKRLAELQASQITYKNTVWHFVRVEG